MHASIKTQKTANKMQILCRVAPRGCRFPPHQPPPLIRISTTAVDCTPSTAIAVDCVMQRTTTGMDLNV
jgi:hypothetical protein